ncbi:MAG TPA: quinone-dependent dihydroorotate dehydrogenase [Caulobacteraceae bacterium]
MSLSGLAVAGLRGLDAEQAHRLAITGLKLGLGPVDRSHGDPVLRTALAGLDLRNPVGLAAGIDKDAVAPDALLRAGFGFVECGTVTPLPQAGNPKPRLFRLSEDRAVINRMGFNNAGLEAFANRLEARRGRPGAVGANIGANKDSRDRAGDYVICLGRLWGLADYFTANVSSPNTPGLRGLQSGEALDELLERLVAERARLHAAAPSSAPLFLKIAPDLDEPAVEAIVAACLRNGLDGLIVSNTTLERDGLRSALREEAGGMSGAPLFERSTRALGWAAEAAAGRLPVIGVGGIASGADAYAKIRAGASAVQLYSAMVFDGPGLVLRVKRELTARLKADGFASVAEAIGAR